MGLVKGDELIFKVTYAKLNVIYVKKYTPRGGKLRYMYKKLDGSSVRGGSVSASIVDMEATLSLKRDKIIDML